MSAPQTGKPMASGWLRCTFGPAVLMCSTLLVAPLSLTIIHAYRCSLRAAVADGIVAVVANTAPPTLNALCIVAAFTVLQYALLVLLPGPRFLGPVTPAGERPEYRHNGVAAWLVTHVAWLVLGPLTGIVPTGQLYDVWANIVTTMAIVALVVCALLYVKAAVLPSSRDVIFTGNVFFDAFQGVELHPRVFGVSVKQLLNCRVSMMQWSLAQLCFAQTQYERGELSSGMVVCTTLHVLYLLKFFMWETAYFTSIDIVHDRCGYCIIWGVLCWVPSVYTHTTLALVELPPRWSAGAATAAVLFGVAMLALNYYADLQRQHARGSDGQCRIWGRKAAVIRAAYTSEDGCTHKSLLLCGGCWGLARHFNYLPELLLALTWSLPAVSEGVFPTYLAFLTALLIDRANRDHEKCAAKYGHYWEQYCRRVPYKILPYVY